MRYLLLSSCWLLLLACGSPYGKLQKAVGDPDCLQQLRPAFTSALYNTQVDVMGRHLSGLLIIKTMPDSSIRMVFSNEMGFKFFDFQFLPDGGFQVHHIISQMNKKPVITTLRKDFELLLMQGLNKQEAFVLKDSTYRYYGFRQGKGYNYYITDTACTRLVRMERASKRKPVAQAIMEHYTKGQPDTIGISHKKFNFTIGLKRIENNVTR